MLLTNKTTIPPLCTSSSWPSYQRLMNYMGGNLGSLIASASSQSQQSHPTYWEHRPNCGVERLWKSCLFLPSPSVAPIDQLCPLPRNKWGYWLLLCYTSKLNTFMLMVQTYKVCTFLYLWSWWECRKIVYALLLWALTCCMHRDKLQYCRPPTVLQMSLKF